MFLNYFVARAGWDVIAIGPNCWPRVIGKEGSKKFVAIIFTKRIFALAHRVAHRKRSLTLCRGCRAIRVYGWVWYWRRDELEGNSWLVAASGRTHLRRITRLWHGRLIGSYRVTRKRWHHDEPAVSQLIVTNNRIAIVPRLALTSKSRKHSIGDNWSV